jgi:hypothetical protein
MNDTSVEIHEDGDEFLPPIALFVNGEVRHLDLFTAEQAPLHSPVHYPVSLIPTDFHNIACPSNRLARLKSQDDSTFECR